MSEIRFRKLFPKDMSGSGIQTDLSKFTRIGMIDFVDSQAGTCTIRWLDRPGKRYNVLLTQGSPGEFNIPKKGEVVIVGFDHNERARILRYVNLGHATKVKNIKSLPKLKEGEKFWECNGSYLHIKSNGDITLSTLTQGYFTLEADSGTLKEEVINLKSTTEAGSLYFGLIKRFKPDNGFREFQNISDDFDEVYTEYRLKMVEKGDGTLGISGIENAFIDITLGTYVDNDGVIVNKKDQNTSLYPTKQLAVRIKMQNGVEIFIDKEGRVTANVPKLNLNNASVDIEDKDIQKGLEVNNANKGKKGQHIAREHDKVVIPFSNSYSDENHLGLQDKASSNLTALSMLAKAIISPAGPCELNSALLTGNIMIEGEITEGAINLYAGDN